MEKLLNDKTQVRLEILTPTSIGAGAESDWAKGVDFVVDNNILYHLNIQLMALAGIDLNRLSSYFAQKKDRDVLQLIKPKLEAVSDFIKSMPCDSSNDVKAFVRNQLTGHPIVPGSSLKGAIKSILFQLFRDNGQTRPEEVFGRLSAGEDFGRFLRISDFEFEDTSLVNTKIYNLHGFGENWEGGWKHDFRGGTSRMFKPVGFNTIYECLMPKACSEGSIMITEKLFETVGNRQPHYEKKRQLLSRANGYTPAENLFYEINSHTYDYLEKEKHFFETFHQGEYSDKIVGNISHLMKCTNDSIEAGNSCILKMAAGSGFHSITGDWQFNDYTKAPLDRKRHKGPRVNPKSRKIAIWGKEHFSLLGFVRLTILD